MSVAFSFIDIVVVAIVLISAIYATYKGLVSESLAIFGWVAAAYATLYFGPWASYWMSGMISPDWVGELIGYAVIFLIVLLPLAFASARIAENVKRSQVGTIDSVLGTAFGILRGIAIVGIAYLIFSMWVPYEHQPDWLVRARLYPVIHGSAEVVASVIPDQHIKAPSTRHRDDRPDPIGDKLDPIGDKLEESRPPPPPREPAARPKPHESEAVPAPKTHPKKHTKKTYGAKDRHALDKLIETTDDDKSGKR